MSIKDALGLALTPAVTWFAVTSLGFHWFPALCLGFLASFLPIAPSALMKGFKAYKKEWNDPRYTTKK